MPTASSAGLVELARRERALEQVYCDLKRQRPFPDGEVLQANLERGLHAEVERHGRFAVPERVLLANRRPAAGPLAAHINSEKLAIGRPADSDGASDLAMA